MKYREMEKSKVNYSEGEIGCVKEYKEEKVEMVQAKNDYYSRNNPADYKQALKGEQKIK